MLYNPDLPEYSNDMYLKGFSIYQIFESNRRTNRKKQKRKREESIFEKEAFNFIEDIATATIQKAVDDMFEPFK